MNRVVIANATQGWQETICYPDTVFAMGTTGITDNVANGDFGRLPSTIAATPTAVTWSSTTPT